MEHVKEDIQHVICMSYQFKNHPATNHAHNISKTLSSLSINKKYYNVNKNLLLKGLESKKMNDLTESQRMPFVLELKREM